MSFSFLRKGILEVLTFAIRTTAEIVAQTRAQLMRDKQHLELLWDRLAKTEVTIVRSLEAHRACRALLDQAEGPMKVLVHTESVPPPAAPAALRAIG